MREDDVHVVAEGTDSNLPEMGGGGLDLSDDQLAATEGNFSAVAEQLGTEENGCKTEWEPEPMWTTEEEVLRTFSCVKMWKDMSGLNVSCKGLV